MSAEGDRRNHPGPGQLEAWVDGELTPAEAAQLERHLESCADCRQLAEDLRGFASLAAEPAAPAWIEEDREKALGRVRERILLEDLATGGTGESGGRERAAPPLPFKRPLRPPSHGIWQLAAAAGILLAAGLGWFAEHQHSEVRRLGLELTEVRGLLMPVANPPNITARRADNPQRGGPESAPAAGWATVVVKSDEDPFPADGSWRLSIFDAEGKKKFDLDGLHLINGELRIGLPPGSLPRGEYRLQLFHDGVAWPVAYVISLGNG